MSTSQANEGRGVFFKIRVFVLLTTLLVVVFVAMGDVRRRKGRNEWDRTLEVAIVLVAPRQLDPRAVAALRERVPTLERRLADEAARHRPGLTAPFKFRVAGPVLSDAVAPKLAGTGPSDLASHAWALRAYTKAIDEAAGVDDGAFDSRIYVTATPPTSAQKAWIEGESDRADGSASSQSSSTKGWSTWRWRSSPTRRSTPSARRTNTTRAATPPYLPASSIPRGSRSIRSSAATSWRVGGRFRPETSG